MAGGVGGILDMIFPGAGGMFSAVVNLGKSLFGGKDKPVVVKKILEPVRTLPEMASIFSAANPHSRQYRGDLALIGPQGVQVEFKGDAKRLLSQVMGERARWENSLEDYN